MQWLKFLPRMQQLNKHKRLFILSPKPKQNANKPKINGNPGYLFKATVQVLHFGVYVVPAWHGQHLHDLGNLHQVVARDVADGDVRRDPVRLRVADGRADEQRKHQVCTRRSHLQGRKSLASGPQIWQ